MSASVSVSGAKGMVSEVPNVSEVLNDAGCSSVLLALALLVVYVIAYHHLKEEINSFQMI